MNPIDRAIEIFTRMAYGASVSRGEAGEVLAELQGLQAAQDVELPPLPEPNYSGPGGTGDYFNGYTGDRMRAYARATIVANRERLEGSYLSWGGYNVRGDAQSIEAVKQLLHEAGTVPELKALLAEARAHQARQAVPQTDLEPDAFREHVEAVIACLVDDAQSLRAENDEDERAYNMGHADPASRLHFAADQMTEYARAAIAAHQEHRAYGGFQTNEIPDRTLHPGGDGARESGALQARQDAPVAHVKDGVLVVSCIPYGYTGPLYLGQPSAHQARQAVPQGWKLVPVPPTQEMVKAVREFLRWGLSETENGARPASALIDALLAAAPTPEATLPTQADPFTYIIQHLNSNPHRLTKDECVALIKELRDLYGQPTQAEAPSLREALRRLENACGLRASLLTADAYNEAIKADGMIEALLELDRARTQARAALFPQQAEAPSTAAIDAAREAKKGTP